MEEIDIVNMHRLHGYPEGLYEITDEPLTLKLKESDLISFLNGFGAGVFELENEPLHIGKRVEVCTDCFRANGKTSRKWGKGVVSGLVNVRSKEKVFVTLGDGFSSERSITVDLSTPCQTPMIRLPKNSAVEPHSSI